MRDVSKKIKQGIRDNKRSRRHEKYFTLVRDRSGNIEATRKRIANVFVVFYKYLYSNKNDERKDKQDSEAGPENTCGHVDDVIEGDEQRQAHSIIHQNRTDDCNRQSQKRTSAEMIRDLPQAKVHEPTKCDFGRWIGCHHFLVMITH